MKHDPYRIDSHKLLFHPRRVADWLEGKNIAPIYMEVSPSGACNHRCVFCALDFMDYTPRFLDPILFAARVNEMASAGVKSMMFAGEGEPFLHKNMVDIAKSTQKVGIDIAFTTNGVLLTEKKSENILPVTCWIKVSFNAGTPKTYATIHRTKESDFAKVLHNIEKAVKIRQKHTYPCTLGFQIILLPENHSETLALAHIVKDIGADYLIVKPYSQHPQSVTQTYADIQYQELQTLADELVKLHTDTFKTVFRHHTIQRWVQQRKSYDKCLALPFWSYIDAGANVWGCSMFLQDEHFYYGNLIEQPFLDIWHGEKRQQSLDFCHNRLDATQCRINCRMDPINAYLWELKHPHGHVNFV